MVTHIQAASLILLLISCSVVRSGEQKTERQLLIDLDREFDQQTAKLGVDGWVKYFAKNGTMTSGDRPPVVGLEAIRKVMTPALKKGNSLRWEPKEAKIWVAGQLGYTTGRYESKTRDKQGKLQIGRGTYITIWKKLADGSWKILFDTGSPDAAK